MPKNVPDLIGRLHDTMRARQVVRTEWLSGRLDGQDAEALHRVIDSEVSLVFQEMRNR